MTADTLKYWEHGQVANSSTSKPVLVTTLRGGQSITLKTLIANTGELYIGHDDKVSSGNGFEMDIGDSLSIEHDISFGYNSVIEIWMLPANTNDKIGFVKFTDKMPAHRKIVEVEHAEK